MKNLFIKQVALVLMILIETTGCKKHLKTEPEIRTAVRYIDLQHQPVSEYNEMNLDLDRNGQSDFLFRVHHVAYNNNAESRLEFSLYSTGSGKIAIDTTDESTLLLAKGVRITPHDFSSFQWLSANKTILMQKSTIDSKSQWTGGFISRPESYLPVKVLRNNKAYCGWIEMEADIKNER